MFIPGNELEKALVAAAKEPAAYNCFIKILLKSDVIVLGRTYSGDVPTPSGPIILLMGSKIVLRQIRIYDRYVVAAFTSLDRLRTFGEERQISVSQDARIKWLFDRTAPNRQPDLRNYFEWIRLPVGLLFEMVLNASDRTCPVALNPGLEFEEIFTITEMHTILKNFGPGFTR
ncbi:MAG: SseB family protein [Aggregatilineales bacterium]